MAAAQKYLLLVDDDKFFGQLICRQLAPEYRTKQVFDGYQAVEIVDQQLPDLILLDILMPAATGFSLLNELISYTDTMRIPVIIVSNTADNLSLSNLQHLGVVAIFDKSKLVMLDLQAAIKTALG